MPSPLVPVESLLRGSTFTLKPAPQPEWTKIADDLSTSPNGCMTASGKLRIERYPNPIDLAPTGDFFDEGGNDGGVIAFWKQRPCVRLSTRWKEGADHILKLTEYGPFLHELLYSLEVLPPSAGPDGVLKSLGKHETAVLWPKAKPSRYLRGLSYVNFESGEVRAIDLGALGEVLGFSGEDGSSVVLLSPSSSTCSGVFLLRGGELKCAGDGDRFDAWVHARGLLLRDGTWTHRPKEAAAGSTPMGEGWSLQQVLSPGDLMHTRIQAPDGSLYAAGKESSACKLQETITIADAPYAWIDCHFLDTNSRRRVLWGLREPIAWELRESVEPTPHELLMVPSSYKIWHERYEGASAWKAWSIEEREFFPYVSKQSRGYSFDVFGVLNYALLLPSKEAPAELVRIRQGELGFESIATFSDNACPGTLTPGATPAFQRDIVVVHCVSPIGGKSLGSKHHWSEVFDLSRGTRWRTRYFVAGISAAGTLLVSHSRKWTSNSRGPLYFARWTQSEDSASR